MSSIESPSDTLLMLLRRLQSESSLREAAFYCLIHDTSTFMRSWIREYGLADLLTQELINVTPQIARLIALTDILSHADGIHQVTNEQEIPQIIPHPADIPQEINEQEIFEF